MAVSSLRRAKFKHFVQRLFSKWGFTHMAPLIQAAALLIGTFSTEMIPKPQLETKQQRWDFDLQTWAAQRHTQACTEPESARGQRSCTALDAGRRSPDGVKSTRRRVFLIIAAIRRCQYQPPTLNYCASHKYSPHALSLDSGRQTYNKNNKKNMKKSINK